MSALSAFEALFILAWTAFWFLSIILAVKVAKFFAAMLKLWSMNDRWQRGTVVIGALLCSAGAEPQYGADIAKNSGGRVPVFALYAYLEELQEWNVVVAIPDEKGRNRYRLSLDWQEQRRAMAAERDQRFREVWE